MRTALFITSSARGSESVSGQLADQFERQLLAAEPGLRITRRNVGVDTIPHLTEATVAAIRGEPQSPAEQEARALSDRLVEELKVADLVVIASPMYNFGMSSTLKTWFDHVLRAGVTFRYTEAGPEGLLKDKKAVVIESRAGLYSEGASAAMDSQEPHLRTLLSFMGIEDVHWVRVEKLAFGPEVARDAVDQAAAKLSELAGEAVELAA